MDLRTKIEALPNGWRVSTSVDGSNWWGIGVILPTQEAAEGLAQAVGAAVNGTPRRYALVSADAGKQDQIAAYMPGNYSIVGRTAIGGTNLVQFLIAGSDVAGWTLDDYVIPRLASGLYFAEEISG